MFEGEEEVCEMTPHSEGAEGGSIIKHNNNARGQEPGRHASRLQGGDDVNEGNSPEPLAKKAKPSAKPAAGVPVRGRGGDGAIAGGGAFGSRAGPP
eukprot:jgi/Tetstr1/426971/TSEL_017184.t1